MPGSKTTPGCGGTRVVAPTHIAFRKINIVGTRIDNVFAAQWLAYAHPCQRFTSPKIHHLIFGQGGVGRKSAVFSKKRPDRPTFLPIPTVHRVRTDQNPIKMLIFGQSGPRGHVAIVR